MLREGGARPADQVAWAFRLLTSRRPSAEEITVLQKLYTEQRELFMADQQAAAKLLAEGETANDPGVPMADLAAGTVLAQALLNHDEAVMRR
jgi:hypothetical protein